MPSPLIKAGTKLSEGQWKRLLKRVLMDEPVAAQRGLLPERIAERTGSVGSLSPRVVDEIFATEPQITRELGSLYSPHPNPSLAEEGVRVVENLPIAEARAKYFANPEGLTPGGIKPPVKEISMSPPASPMPEDLAAAISYARNKFSPIIPPSVKRAQSSMTKEDLLSSAENQLVRRGLSPEDISVSPTKFLAGEGQKATGEQALKEILGNALEADQIWKEMAGGMGTPEAKQLMAAESIRGRGSSETLATALWRKLLGMQGAAVRQTFNSPKDWFAASYNKWKKNPIEFAKKHPREASLLDRIKSVYEGGGE